MILESAIDFDVIFRSLKVIVLATNGSRAQPLAGVMDRMQTLLHNKHSACLAGCLV